MSLKNSDRCFEPNEATENINIHIYIYRPGTPNNQFFNGCFNRMIPNHDIKNGCFTKHPLKDSCLGYQAYMYMYCMWVNQLNVACDTAIQSYTLLYYTILSYPVLYLYHTIPYHTILYCTTLLYIYSSWVSNPSEQYSSNVDRFLNYQGQKFNQKNKKTWGFVALASHDWKTSCKVHFNQRFYSQKTSNPVT